jgi:hypothetical protein
MKEPGFLEGKEGSMGEISYFIEIKNNISQKQKDSVLNQSSSAHIEKLITDLSLGNNPHVDPNFVYKKSREEGNKLLKAVEKSIKMLKITVQNGNKESLKEIEEIEKLPNFKGWQDKEFINNFKKKING